MIFKVVIAPAFSRCASCQMELAGRKCWMWLEQRRECYGCRLCLFKDARIEVPS